MVWHDDTSYLADRTGDSTDMEVSDIALQESSFPKPRLARSFARRLLYFVIVGSLSVAGCTSKRTPVSVSRPVIRMPSIWSPNRLAPLESPKSSIPAPPPPELPAPEFTSPESMNSPSDVIPPERSPSLNRSSDSSPAPSEVEIDSIEMNPQALHSIQLEIATPPSLAMTSHGFDSIFDLPYCDEPGVVRRVTDVDVAQAKLVGSGVPWTNPETLDSSSDGASGTTISAQNANIHATSAIPPTLQEVTPGRGVLR